METKKSVFEMLNEINVSDRIEKKGRLNYLSWAWAWGELKKRFPDASSRVYEREDGRIYWDDGKTCWVKCSVTVQGQEIIEYLPIMDSRNTSIPLENVTSMDVNKTIQRCITKAIGRHGLGLYIYQGEDLPEDTEARNEAALQTYTCADCGKVIEPFKNFSAAEVADRAHKQFGRALCLSCGKKAAAAAQLEVQNVQKQFDAATQPPVRQKSMGELLQDLDSKA
jgi:hypothetical protein